MSAGSAREARSHGAGGARTQALRLWLADDRDARGRMCLLREPFRFGFGEECDVSLEGDAGPAVLFAIEQTDGPLLVAKAIPREEFDRFVELQVDGEPMPEAVRELAQGSRLDVVDRASRRHYRFVVHPPLRTGILRPRNLAITMLVLAIAGAAFGGYLYWSLRGARTDISRTIARVERAEADVARTEARLHESISRLEYTEAELGQAIADLRGLQEASAREIRTEFSSRIKAVDESTQRELERLAEEDTQAREALASRARADIDQMRAEFSDRMVESYQRLKSLEQRLLASMAERLAANEPAGARFKRIFAEASRAIVFIRARYTVEFVRTGEVSEQVSLGSGFIVSPSGLVVTAQHVLFPWRYERELLVLEGLGLARIVEDSVRWDVWPTGAAALSDPDDPQSFDVRSAYKTGDGERSMRVLLVPEIRSAAELIASPIGVVEVRMPQPGASDVAVLQLDAFDAPLSFLSPSPVAERLEPLDEVLVLGYPFSRLHEGIAAPQAVRGFVRRAGQELLELDAAVHPGVSGGPVLDAQGAVAGMIMAIMSSELYGVALRAEALVTLLEATRAAVLAEEKRLAALGCDPGVADGEFDRQTWAAYGCEDKRGALRDSTQAR